MKKIILLVVLTIIVAFFSLKLSALDIVLSLLSLPMLFLIFSNFPVRQHLVKYIMLFVIFVSVVFIPAFHLSYDTFTGDQYSLVFSFGIKLLIASSLFWLFLCLFIRKRNFSQNYSQVKISDAFVFFFLLGAIALSLFSFSIGLGRMGAEAVRLPFHIGGSIMVVRMFLIPYLFMIIYENFILTKRMFYNSFFLLYLIWCIIEVFCRLSKGALVVSLLPPAIIHWLYFRPPIKKMLPYILPVLFVFFSLYPIIQNMRYVDRSKSLIESFWEVESESDNLDERGNVYIKSLNRTFMTMSQYARDYYIFSDEDSFDFSRAPAIIALGGTARYQTIMIDGYDDRAVHSSGTTGIMDPLLFGGYGFCFFVMFLLMWMAIIIDNNFYRGMHSVYVIMLLLFLSFMRDRNVSYPFSDNGIPYLISYIVSVFIAIKYNFRSCRISA